MSYTTGRPYQREFILDINTSHHLHSKRHCSDNCQDNLSFSSLHPSDSQTWYSLSSDRPTLIFIGSQPEWCSIPDFSLICTEATIDCSIFVSVTE